jgi:hypothetical protein
MSKTQESRLLAVDLRTRRLGYAVFQTPNRLLDFGISQFDSPATAAVRVRVILKAFRPAVVIFDAGPTRGPRNKTRTALVRQAIRREASKMSIPATVLPARTLRAFFSERGVRNKYAFAHLSAKWFPQLSRRVPAERECYESEPWIMAWLDAVLLGIVYLAQSDNESAEFFRRSLSDE